MRNLSFLSLRATLDAHDKSLSYKRAVAAGFGVLAYALLHFWPPLNTAFYLALYLLLLYPPLVAMRVGLGATAKPVEAAPPAHAEADAVASLPLAA